MENGESDFADCVRVGGFCACGRRTGRRCCNGVAEFHFESDNPHFLGAGWVDQTIRDCVVMLQQSDLADSAEGKWETT